MRSKAFLLLPILFIFFTKNAHSFLFSENKCEKLEWVIEDSRTQGGGWIWFSGKGQGQTLEESYNYSENLALQRLAQECQKIPITSKFIERCDQKNGDIIESFVRVSVKDSDCQQAQQNKIDLNQQLQSQLNDYIQLKNMKEIRGRDDDEKFNYAKTLLGENPILGEVVLKSLCDKSFKSSCHFYLSSLIENKKYTLASEESSKRCLNGDEYSCDIFVKVNLATINPLELIEKIKKDENLKKIVQKAKNRHLSGYFYAQLEQDNRKKMVIHKGLCHSGSALSCYEGAAISISLDSNSEYSSFINKLNELAENDKSNTSRYLRARLLDLLGKPDSSKINDDEACKTVFYSCLVQFLRSNNGKYYDELKKHSGVIKAENSFLGEIARDVQKSNGSFEGIFKSISKDKKRYEKYCKSGLWDICQLLLVQAYYNEEKSIERYNPEVVCSLFPQSYGCYLAKGMEDEDKLEDLAKLAKDYCIEGRSYQDEACDYKVNLITILELVSAKKNKSKLDNVKEAYKKYCESSHTSMCRMLFPESASKTEKLYLKKCFSNSVESYYYCKEIALSSLSKDKDGAKKKLMSMIPEVKLVMQIKNEKKSELDIQEMLGVKLVDK